MHGERSVYESPWVSVHLADVELPGGERIEHHVLRIPRGAVAVVVTDPERGVLLIHRHRFIPDAHGWEVPAGRREEGEDEVRAAAREVEEETGWRPRRLELLGTHRPLHGISDIEHAVVLGVGADPVGTPDPAEADRVEWVPVARVLDLIRAGEMPDGYSQNAVLLALLLGRLDEGEGREGGADAADPPPRSAPL